MRLSTLLRSGEFTSVYHPEHIKISGISIKPSAACVNQVFFSLHQKVDPQTLLPLLSHRGVSAVITQDETFDSSEIPVFHVPSVRRALAHAWDRLSGEPTKRLSFIGITGTNGKTSTAYFLNNILLQNGISCAMIGTLGLYINGERMAYTDDMRSRTMTTPDPDILYPFLARAAEAGVTHVVMEVSSHALVLEKVSPITFCESIFTNLSPEHLDFHKTMDEYAEAKKKLFSKSLHATINCDDVCGAAIRATTPYSTNACGILWESDAKATQVTVHEGDCYSYFYQYQNVRQLIRLQVGGQYQVYNSLLALTSSLYLGIPAGGACRALQSITGIPGRLQRVSTSKDDIQVYIDFAHTEGALRELLINLRSITGNKLIVLFGCGGERDALKRPLMGEVAMQYADFSVITSDNCRGEDVSGILKEILSGHTDPAKRKVIVDRERAIQYAIHTADKHDTIVLAGKGHEEYEIKKDGLHPFSEFKIATAALEMRRAGHTTPYKEMTDEN